MTSILCRLLLVGAVTLGGGKAYAQTPPAVSGASSTDRGIRPVVAPPPPIPTAPAPAAAPAPVAAAAAAPAAAVSSASTRSSAPKEAYVYIGWPVDGATVNPSQIKVWFGTRNFGVAPAGVTMRNTGHHHLLIDVPLPPANEPIPSDKNHLHFGLGQTETLIDLPPGRHTLQLMMGDANHIPHDPPVISKRITINVRGPSTAP